MDPLVYLLICKVWPFKEFINRGDSIKISVFTLSLSFLINSQTSYILALSTIR